MTDARAEAAQILAQLLGGGVTLERAMNMRGEVALAPRDRALVRELSYGVLRFYFRLQFIADRLLEKPVRSRDSDIRALLLCGLYQLRELRIPDHAAISATVNAARALGKDWAVGLINAVLRRYQREADAVEALAERDRCARYLFPDWLLDALQQDWPAHWESIVDAANGRPPLHLRVNLALTSRREYLQELEKAGISASASGLTACGLWLPEPMDVEALPGFDAGKFAVQDFGAQLAADLLGAKSGDRVLDACAAPGGKTTHISESCSSLGELVAVEADSARMNRLHRNVERMRARAEVLNADALDPASWWDGRPFDRVLLDAPCSATGVIRRHPDIKVMRTAAQCTQLADTQQNLLAAIWPLVARGGRMLYSTCSLLHRENDEQIEKFLSVNKDASLVRIDVPWGLPTGYGRQTIPGKDDTDGFYYALLERNR